MPLPISNQLPKNNLNPFTIVPPPPIPVVVVPLAALVFPPAIVLPPAISTAAKIKDIAEVIFILIFLAIGVYTTYRCSQEIKANIGRSLYDDSIYISSLKDFLKKVILEIGFFGSITVPIAVFCEHIRMKFPRNDFVEDSLGVIVGSVYFGTMLSLGVEAINLGSSAITAFSNNYL